jgi:GTP:adenosylcobinamide-phosphate guanylyltransferase
MSTAQLQIIVQAGGRGSRLRHHTWNKPKCLVSVRGKPLLYHLFERYPAARFVVIGDYAFEQMEKYLKMNPPAAQVELIQTEEKGTASGIAAALERIDPDAPLLLTWSDLIIGELPAWPDGDLPVVCTTAAFTCRWTVSAEGKLHEAPADRGGIPGLFYFPQARSFPPPPPKGEFVKWFAANVHDFTLLDCPDMEELGDFSSIEESNDRAGYSRFFNHVEVGERTVVKTVVDPNYAALHQKEIAWHAEASRLGFRRAPAIHSTAPLTMARIAGQHAYQMNDLSERERRAVLADYLDALTSLHDTAEAPVNLADVREVYLDKTVSRVQSVSAIIPNFERAEMTINGKKCRNPFAAKHAGMLESILPGLVPERFVPIHGDATFSNTLVDDKLRVWFIDPRGYFAQPGILGDAWYDFAKVYYSAVGGYDSFNRRKFKLHVDHDTVEILMEEPLFAKTAQDIFKDYFGKDKARIEVLHGLIWLALSGYARDDIDSVIGSFYMGLYWLEVGMSRA